MKLTYGRIRDMIREHEVQDISLTELFLERKKHKVSSECSEHVKCRHCDARANARCFNKALNDIRMEEIPYLLDATCWQVRRLDGTLDLQELSLYYKYVKRAYAHI